jgi:hypothetical protein
MAYKSPMKQRTRILRPGRGHRGARVRSRTGDAAVLAELGVIADHRRALTDPA